MNLWNKLKPGAPKQVLILVAASLWGFASYRILKMALIKIDHNAAHLWLNYSIGIAGFIPFYWFVFRKVGKRYVLRIINLKQEKPCIFAFFDIRGYILMTLMISMGITISRLHLLPDLYLGTFFISLGLSLLAAAVYYLYAGYRFYFSKKTELE
jgi:hypothetical protein